MTEISPGHRPKRKPKGKRAKKPPIDPTITGGALRQKFVSTAAEDLRARMAAIPRGLPVNGPDANGVDDFHPIYREIVTKFSDHDVDAVFDAIRSSGVVEYVTARIDARKGKDGRPTEIPYRSLLVGMLLTAMDGKGCLASEIAKTLFRRLSPTAMALLDLKPLPEPNTATEARRQRWRIERRTRAALHRFLSTIDPSIHPKGTSMPWTQLRELDRPLTEEEIEERRDALFFVCNTILRIPYCLLPARVRRKYRGSACVDGTPLSVHSTGRGVDSEIASTDPDAAYGARAGDHLENGDVSISKSWFGYEINLVTAVCDWLGTRQYMPALPYLMHLDRPGVDPAGNAGRLTAFLEQTGHVPRFLAGDPLYARADPVKFHAPARAAGWQLVLPILDENLGIQGTYDGFLLIEGHWYCPSIPQHLIDATKDFREGDIDQDTYRQRIENRAPYRARLKGNNTSGSQRWGCAASGSYPSVICANKEKSEEKKFIGGPVIGYRLKDRIIPDPATQTNGMWPKPCRQETLTIDLSDGDPEDANWRNIMRSMQSLIYGEDDHTNTYNALRQSQEGLHGFAKDDAYEALGTPGKRRIRGLAAQSLFAGFLLAAAGVRKVRAFLRDASTDENGDLYVIRRTRKGEHAATHLPPGTQGTRGDPDLDRSDTDD